MQIAGFGGEQLLNRSPGEAEGDGAMCSAGGHSASPSSAGGRGQTRQGIGRVMHDTQSDALSDPPLVIRSNCLWEERQISPFHPASWLC